jgi:hypothetical protein
LKREDLDEFVQCYNPENRHQRTPTWSEKNPNGRWRAYDYEELINRDRARLDIFWLRDESLEESDNLLISQLPMFSPRKSSKTSKPPSNNSAKSQMIWVGQQRKKPHERVERNEVAC